MDQSMGEMRHGAPSLDLNASGPVCSAHPGESQASMSIAVGEEIHGKDFLDDGTSVEFSARCTEATSGWTRRVRIGKAPVEREMSAARKSALELSVRAYITKRDGNVANPVIGTSFDSIDEAYNFYNLYSWEGKPVKDNIRSSRCGCNAMIRLLRDSEESFQEKRTSLIAAREEHVYIEEGTGDFDPMVAGVCYAEELVLDDGDNASCVGAVDDKADEDDAESRPTKRAKL
ncbi:hypothetical protein ZWY2020_007170 [Hordeum vulgare]|nr:hypothetical protein ZWY2020_007170 [Hordeum vulgare]